MRYFGGKDKLGKKIANIINKYLDDNKNYYELFIGGGGVLKHINSKKCIINDIHSDLTAMYIQLKNGWKPTDEMKVESIHEYMNDLKSEYENYKSTKIKKYTNGFYGFIGHTCSFMGIYFDTFIKSNSRNYYQESIRNISKTDYSKIQKIYNQDFFELVDNLLNKNIANQVFYLDPPYKNESGYKFNFNYDKFWNYVNKLSENNTVFISEYNAPKEYISILNIERKVGGAKNKENTNKQVSDKLFIHKKYFKEK